MQMLLDKSNSNKILKEVKEVRKKSQGKLLNNNLQLEQSPNKYKSKFQIKTSTNSVLNSPEKLEKRKVIQISKNGKNIQKKIESKIDKKSGDKKIKYKSEQTSPSHFKKIYKKNNEKTFNTNKLPQKSNKDPYDKNTDINSNKNKLFKNNNLTRNNNSKNTHKIINRKKGINFSTKSLNLNNHISDTLYDNNSIKKPKKKDKKSDKKLFEKKEINSSPINQTNIKTQNNKEPNINKNNNKYETKKSNKDLNKTYSESDLGEVGGVIDDEDSESENLLKEVNETDDIYYYDPKSIVNYSSANFTNKRNNNNKKYQSLSVSKNNIADSSKYNNTFNKTINKSINRSLFSGDLNLTQHMKLQTQNFEKINKIEEINQKIKMKNNDIERIKKYINNMKNQINKYNNEIKNMNKMIFDEEQEGYKLKQMINFFINIK
jgi:hypothetical protein